MQDENIGTQPTNGKVGTDGTPTAATQPETPTGGASQQAKAPDNNADGTVTLKEQDYKNLVAARDRNANDERTLAERLDAVEAEKYRDQAITATLKDYPLVPRSILESAVSPEQLETLAKDFTAELEKAKEAQLKSLATVNVDDLTEEQASESLDKLKNSGNLAGAIATKLRIK